jgi:hypothetical protein
MIMDDGGLDYDAIEALTDTFGDALHDYCLDRFGRDADGVRIKAPAPIVVCALVRLAAAVLSEAPTEDLRRLITTNSLHLLAGLSGYRLTTPDLYRVQ